MADWKHRQAEVEVEGLLRMAALVDPAIVQVFPRPIGDILCAALPAIEIHKVEDLSVERIHRTLFDKYGVNLAPVDASSSPVTGFTFADRRCVCVFVETKHGPDVARFTLAHEAGHIVKEVLPRLLLANEPALFADDAFLTHDDSLEVIASGAGLPIDLSDDDAVRVLREQRSSWMREVVANIIAAELLAPWREVEKIARAAEHSHEAVSIVRDCFGLSLRAARIRLEELQLIDHDAPRLF